MEKLERFQELTVLAVRAWNGHGNRQGDVKISALKEAVLLSAVPALEWQPIDAGLEFAVDPDAQCIRVRRQRLPGQKGLRQDAESQVITVIGHEQGGSAYHRTVHTRLVTFQCAWCGETVIQQRYPGPRPIYCCDEPCRQLAERERARERAQRYRENHRAGKAETQAEK